MLHRLVFLLACLVATTNAFTSPSPLRFGTVSQKKHALHTPLHLSDDNKDSMSDGVVELGDDDDEPEPQQQVAPFLSQGEIADDVLNPDLSDPQQTRVIIYIILSLIPVLFLIPLMLGSRDLIPLDALPPVDI